MANPFNQIKKWFENFKHSRKSPPPKKINRLLEAARDVRWEAEKRKRSTRDNSELAWLEQVIWLTRECEKNLVQKED
jgi:hypothetical protein